MNWYFDFISPYAYLQSTRLQEFEAHGPVQCVPVLFAGLLNHFENVGPAELAPKRQWTFEYCAWLAHRNGVDLTMPACHPFNPLPLLRLCIAAGSTTAAVQRIFRFVWADGYNPDDEAAFDTLCSELGVSPADLAADRVKQALRTNTETATAAGVFGVPTLTIDDERFWGFDGTDMALDWLSQQGSASNDPNGFPTEKVRAARNMPVGSARRRRPDEAPGTQATGQSSTPPSPGSAPRIDYLPADLAEPADVVDAVRRRRGGELLELDRMLLYSPPLTRGWNSYLGAVRNELELDPNLRELAMCVVAVINGAEYEFTQHQPIYIQTGASREQADALRDPDSALQNTNLFNETQRAALGLCIDMTRTVQVNQAHFDTCEKQLGRRQLVELIATIAAYNMVSRFLVALNVQPHTHA